MKDLTLDTTLKVLVLASTSDFGVTCNSTYVLCLLLCTRPRTHLHGLFLCGPSQQLIITEVSINFLSFHHPRSDLLQETDWYQTNPSLELN